MAQNSELVVRLKYLSNFLGVYQIIYFEINYKVTATDLSKQQKLDADPKVIQQIKLTGNQKKIMQKCFLLLKKQMKLNWILMQYQYKMTKYNTVNVKLSNLQLYKLKQ